jgi:hypothetical protein
MLKALQHVHEAPYEEYNVTDVAFRDRHEAQSRKSPPLQQDDQ